jgi:hypothetical protein
MDVKFYRLIKKRFLLNGKYVFNSLDAKPTVATVKNGTETLATITASNVEVIIIRISMLKMDKYFQFVEDGVLNAKLI